MSSKPLTAYRLAFIPAIITLAVTGARLFGELQGWDEPLVSRDIGANALIGIAWLVPLFGLWFGMRLTKRGRNPKNVNRAWILPLIGIGLGVGAGLVAKFILDTNDTQMILYVSAGFAIGAVLCGIAWPALFVTNLVYGLLARLPVIAVTFLALWMDWNVHYTKVPKDAEVGSSAMEQGMFLSIPQIIFWVPFTIVVAGFAGGLGAKLSGSKKS